MLRFIALLSCLTILSCSSPNNSSPYILFDFESEADLDLIRWKCQTLFALSGEHASHGSSALMMELYPSDTPGYAQRFPVNDWTGYRSLCLDAYNPQDDELEIGVRIDDFFQCPDLNDCCHRYFVVRPGPNTVCLPLDTLTTGGTNRKLDLSAMRQIFVFMVRPATKTVLYLDYFRLTKER